MQLSVVSEQKKEISKIYHDFLDALDEREQSETKQELKPYIDQMMSGEFRLVVMGEIKKGKSSFINALFGDYDLLPLDSNVATSTVYQITYGPAKKITVYFNPETSKQQSQEITQEQIPEYGTEEGNPGNKKQVELIQIQMPHPLLEQGLVIVDTPGVGGLFKKHRDITYKYAPSADAVFFVVDSVEAVISAEEIKFLKDLYKITKHIYFIQTKTDAVDSEIWQAWKDRNIDILITNEELAEIQLTKDTLKYFTVSSKTKQLADEDPDSEDSAEDLEDSGFIQINEFLFDYLIAEKNKIRNEVALNHLIEKIDQHKLLVIENLKNVQETDKNKIADKERKIEAILCQLEEWKDGSWKEVFNRFSSELSQKTQACKDAIHNRLSPDQPNFQAKIDEVKKRYTSIDVLVEQNDEIIGNYIAFCAETGKHIIEHYLADVEKAFYELTQNALSDLAEFTKIGDFSIDRTSLNFKEAFSYAGTAFDAAAGGLVGSAVAGGMWWALVGATEAAIIAGPGGALAFGVAAAAGPLGWAAIGAVGLLGAAGTFWGCNKIRNSKKLDAAIEKLRNNMSDISYKSSDNFRNNVDKIKDGITTGSRRLLESVERQSKHKLEIHLADIKKAKELTADEAVREAHNRQKYLERINALLDQLHSIRQGVAKG